MTATVQVAHAVKSFNGTKVVHDLSFEVQAGEVFALIGPNGAGKTTTIRMLLDIIRPDSGEVLLFGFPFRPATKDRIGYLPEDRGLYRKLTVSETIRYFASLKGVSPQEGERRAAGLLQRVGMLEHRKKKVEELSRGMGQLVQFVATIAHGPDLVILDEPFSGLDPVNTQLLKDIVGELKMEGKTVILSTHRMGEVEEMCDRLLMIDRGAAILYGTLRDIKARFAASGSVLVECAGDPGEIAGVSRKKARGGLLELSLEAGVTPQQILHSLVARGVELRRFEIPGPSLHDIFVQLVRSRGGKD